ncbi:hypothetical protein JG688_00015444 [Phytophthora aleatoria]|uniref:Uncharacterized protein n=1 Tax=Phytophthora aleatoria TaxID=2496075 RepID=A0A8J5IA42_9STRA|nr:hypothetical protein JG688_00015444 [Phytophthora aleatoria]
MLQDERDGQIERFVNDGLKHALQEAQREAQIVASSKIEGVRQKMEKIEANVDGGLENISGHIQQLVEDIFAASRLETSASEETTQLVQLEVEASAKKNSGLTQQGYGMTNSTKVKVSMSFSSNEPRLIHRVQNVIRSSARREAH